MSELTATRTDGRLANGRWAKGTSGNPIGYSSKLSSTRSKYLSVLYEESTDEQFRKAVQSLIADAIEGIPSARKLFFGYILGPMASVAIRDTQNIEYDPSTDTKVTRLLSVVEQVIVHGNDDPSSDIIDGELS